MNCTPLLHLLPTAMSAARLIEVANRKWRMAGAAIIASFGPPDFPAKVP
jgi:hypothetical protein